MATYQHISHGFEPVFDERSRILVLGSIPSVLSRKNEFYYGNPRNRFWHVMANVLGAPVPPNAGDPLTGSGSGSAASGTAGPGAAGDGAATLSESIAAKKALLLEGGVALWDVIEECDIKGSSDASIKNVVPARVGRVLERARIEAIVCNGNAAGRLYKRFLQWETGIEAHVLPSTSPANAAWDLARLTERWKREFSLIADEVAAADAARGREEGQAEAAGGAKARGRGKTAGASGGRRGRVAYAVMGSAPAASSYAVHKSMQGNKRKDTGPELLVRERLREAGLGGYRLQWNVPGRPDVAWPGKKVCLFINGCFWHRCPRCNPSVPKKNVEYWTAKFARNVERDRENETALREQGWRVHTIWECELKKSEREATFERLLPELAHELGKELAIEEAAHAGAKGCEAAETPAHASPSGSSGPVANADAYPSGSAASPAPDGAPDGTDAARDHFMYVIRCADGTLYTGYTPDVEARFAAHQAGAGAKYTRGRGPLTLLASARFQSKHDAMSAEYRFKRLSRKRKDELLSQAAHGPEPFEEILERELLS